MTKTKIDHSKLKATPHQEDFRHKYESGRVGQLLIEGYFKIVNELCDQIPKKGKIHALEIGCGEGYSTQRLRKMLPKNVDLEASEFVKDLLPYAKKLNPNIKIFQESAYELKAKDNSLDIVFLLEVLEHLDYPEAALTEIRRVLRPGGYLILGVPREPLWRMINFSRGKYTKDLGNTPGHLNHWSKRGLRELVNNEVGEIVSARSPVPWTIVLAQKAKK